MIYLLIVLITCFIASRGNLMYENITGVSLMDQYHVLVIIYTIGCSLFFAYQIFHLFQKYQLSQYNIFIYIQTFLMCIGAFFPYTLNSNDIYSSLHVYCSMIASIGLLVLLLILTRKLLYLDPTLYQRTHWYYDFGLQFLCLLLIVFTRVNGYIEILFVIIVCYYLYLLQRK